MPQALGASDVELIERMTRGDRSALATLYQRHAASLLAVARCILHDRPDAEDVIHDVFLEVWRNCGSYSDARASVRTWLIMRARSRALDRLRANNRRNAAGRSADPGLDVPKQPSDVMLHDKQRLLSALAHVPEPQQGVIMLAYFEGLSTAEISARLGIPTGTVKSRTHAAIKTLRSVLGLEDE